MGIQDSSTQPIISEKVQLKASILIVEPLFSCPINSWRVKGGSEPHFVYRNPNWNCDCYAFQWRGICSHIIAVQNFLKENENVE